MLRESNHIPFRSLCVCCEGWRTNQSCKRNLTLCETQGARKWTRFSVFDVSINCCLRWGLCLQATKRLICRKVCFKHAVNKFQVKKGLIGLQDSYQHWLFFWVFLFVFLTLHMYNEFFVLDVLIVLLYMWRLISQGYWFKQCGEERCMTTLKTAV